MAAKKKAVKARPYKAKITIDAPECKTVKYESLQPSDCFIHDGGLWVTANDRISAIKVDSGTYEEFDASMSVFPADVKITAKVHG